MHTDLPNKVHTEPGPLPVQYLRRIESIVLYVIGVLLVVFAVVLLGSSIYQLFQAIASGEIKDKAIEVLDTVLLAMMVMEIMYTVTLSIESHTLIAEPFLIVGAIAAIRRMLVITANSTKMETNPELFRSTLFELGLLALTIVIIAIAVYLLRSSTRYQTTQHEAGK